MNAYEKIWIVGDRFITDSKNILWRLLGVRNMVGNDEPASNAGESGYMASNFDVKAYGGADNLRNRSVLGRLHNALVNALIEDRPLPKYMLVVIDDDILRCVKFNRQGLSMVFGRCIQWLADEMHTMIVQLKEKLPNKAKKASYPLLFWVALPYHCCFPNNNIQFKFNQSMEKVVPLYENMKILKIRRRWNYVDDSVSPLGSVSPAGHIKYWSGVDEALQFWEIGRKKGNVGDNFH